MKRRSQPRSRTGARVPRSASLLAGTAALLDLRAEYYGVSRSWVQNVATAEHLGVRIPREADYREQPRGRK